MNTKPVVIAAVPKSGSSLIAKIFQAHGFWVGAYHIKPSYAGREAYPGYENPDIDRWLKKPKGCLLEFLANLVPVGERLVYKCNPAKAAKFIELVPQAVLVKCGRNLGSIIRSSPKNKRKLRFKQYEEFRKLEGPVIDADAIINRDFSSLQKAMARCGVELDCDLAEQQIDDKLWHVVNINPFHNRPDEWALYNPLHGDSMLELGGKINAGLTYKAYFESLGFRHVSVDWDGQHGALNRDLRKPLDLGQFDMVCNIGTTEHVSKQAGVWANVHRACKVGGVYVGVTPYYDGNSWWWHGEWYPREEFYKQFAELNGWTIERLYTDREPPHQNLYCRMVKEKDLPFTMPEAHTIHYNQRRSR